MDTVVLGAVLIGPVCASELMMLRSAIVVGCSCICFDRSATAYGVLGGPGAAFIWRVWLASLCGCTGVLGVFALWLVRPAGASERRRCTGCTHRLQQAAITGRSNASCCVHTGSEFWCMTRDGRKTWSTTTAMRNRDGEPSSTAGQPYDQPQHTSLCSTPAEHQQEESCPGRRQLPLPQALESPHPPPPASHFDNCTICLATMSISGFPAEPPLF